MNALLTPVALAKRWNLKIGTLVNWRAHKMGPAYVKLGRRIMYQESDVLEYERNHVVRNEVRKR